MITSLREATRERCGGKAASLGVLLRAGLPVPDGFVVLADAPQDRADEPDAPDCLADAPDDLAGAHRAGHEGALRRAVARELARLGDPVVAVRSSALDEDTAGASAAGQYESVLGVRGVADVCDAIAVCRASARSTRVAAYRSRTAPEVEELEANQPEPGMAVLVQPLVPADVAGVMFTPAQPGGPARIESSWGLGVTVVGGTVDPDVYEVASDGDVRCTIGGKQRRTYLETDALVVVDTSVDESARTARSLGEAHARALAGWGSRAAALLGGAQDVEWALAGGEVWILQARPVTAPVPRLPLETTGPPSARSAELVGSGAMLTGSPGAHGLVTARARLVREPADFGRVRAGEIVVCPYTDPAWTPLFGVAAGVVTETGGTLSHAAIVAREYGIPAVLGVAGALRHIDDDEWLTLDGGAGTITRHAGHHAGPDHDRN